MRSALITSRYVKAGQGRSDKQAVYHDQPGGHRFESRPGHAPGMDFFLSIEKRKSTILEGISSSLNIHLSDCHRKGRRVKKGMVGIIRSG